MRPTSLDDVVGQEHIIGKEGWKKGEEGGGEIGKKAEFAVRFADIIKQHRLFLFRQQRAENTPAPGVEAVFGDQHVNRYEKADQNVFERRDYAPGK